jgi:AmmeMemoRadiSam system protein B
MFEVRPSPIAGTWYPGDAETLAKSVDRQLAAADARRLDGDVIALVVPHAGHRYSGGVAAHAFRLVEGLHPEIVAVLGPMHHPFPASVLSSDYGSYATPLGRIPVDDEALRRFEGALADRAGISVPHVAQDPEHSLEIELPFLQRTLPSGFRLLPLMLRAQSTGTARAVGQALAASLKGHDALIVASSDLSHFYPSEVARRLDREMLSRIERFDPELLLDAEAEGVGFACGKGAIAAALWAARELGADTVRIVAYANSGDVTGDNESVVGYGAAVIYRAGAPA